MTTSKQIRCKIEEYIHKNELSFEDQVKLISHLAHILNLQTRSNYAKQNNKCYNAHQFAKNKIKISGVEFIADPD